MMMDGNFKPGFRINLHIKDLHNAIDTGHVFYAQQNVAQNVEVAARYNKLFMMHVNDNYNLWDDDMIAGSLRYTEYIEMFYALRVPVEGYLFKQFMRGV